MGLQPRRLRQVDDRRLHHAFAETCRRHAEVLISVVQFLLCQLQAGVGLAELLFALAHLKHNHLFCVIIGILLDLGFSLGHARLVVAFAPMEDRDFGHHAEVPHAAKLVLEAVETRGVAHRIVAESPNRGQVVGAGDPHLLGIDVVGNAEAFQFGTMGFDIAFRIERMGIRHQHIIKVLVRQHDVGIQRQTTDLAKQHLRQGKAILCLQQRRLRFVQLHFHRKLVGSGRHTFGH